MGKVLRVGSQADRGLPPISLAPSGVASAPVVEMSLLSVVLRPDHTLPSPRRARYHAGAG